MLYPIHAMGIRAYCSELIIDPHDIETVYFLSIAGYQATVKGIIANLLDQYGISIEIDGEEYYLNRSSLGYKTMGKKLPSGLVHIAVFPKLALPKNEEEQQNSFYIFADRQDDRLSLFFRHLDEKTHLPLHESWAGWLWEVFEQEEWLLKLKSLAGKCSGYFIKFNPKHMHDIISEAIRNRNPAVYSCFEWKGDNDATDNIIEGFFG